MKFFTCRVGVGGVKGHTVATGEAAALVRRHSTMVNAGVLRTIVTFQRHVRRGLVEKEGRGETCGV